MAPTVEEVREFWENHPLFTGESIYSKGSFDFFEEHRKTVIEDGFAGKLNEKIFPIGWKKEKVLDLGCGPGFWTIELACRGCIEITAADLTDQALSLTAQRCSYYFVKAGLSNQNAEQLTFQDGMFTHVNCQGVIHHTPNTENCIKEIARVLESGGSASISVYHKNIYLRVWPYIGVVIGRIMRCVSIFRGRGREGIFRIRDVSEVVRLFDGDKNPVGKAFTKKQFLSMLNEYFYVDDVFYHYFPVRIFKIRIPKLLHRILDKYSGFMISAVLTKR